MPTRKCLLWYVVGHGCVNGVWNGWKVMKKKGTATRRRKSAQVRRPTKITKGDPRNPGRKNNKANKRENKNTIDKVTTICTTRANIH